ncbi:MAG: hypothetical protein JW779_07065 [Candidatus Thorarchaeota archaeon]|nr:hypothetical protein [Candidatus Thorarchaeota archaeon]
MNEGSSEPGHENGTISDEGPSMHRLWCCALLEACAVIAEDGSTLTEKRRIYT